MRNAILVLTFRAVEVENFQELIKETENEDTCCGFFERWTAVEHYGDAEGRIQNRRERQQQRIGEGVENGKLTPKETAHLEHKQANLNKQIRTERKANGGTLTAQEKKQINREQNHLSRNIYRTKHDGPKQ